MTRTHSTPLVSIVLPTLNANVHLDEALTSIDRQTYPNLRLVVVDDGSTDHTLETIRGFDWRPGRSVHIVERDAPDDSLAAALNDGLAVAAGDYVARHDADDWSAPGRIARQVAHLESNPDVAVVGTGCAMHDADGTSRGHRRVLRDVTADDLAAKNQLVHGSILARPDVLDAVGGYDDRWIASEDYELWCRLAEAGYGVHNIDAPLYHLRLRSDSVFASDLRASKLYGRLTAKRAGHELDARSAGNLAAAGAEAIVDHLSAAELQAIETAIAQELVRYGAPVAAASAALTALRQEPTDAMAWVSLGLAVVPDGLSQTAIQAYRRRLNAGIDEQNATTSLPSTGQEPTATPARAD